jgi:prolyl oligopeptidase
MNRAFATAAKAALLAAVVFVQACRGSDAARTAYPAARTVEQTDQYHGTTVRDPYRWMEDLESEETRAWVKAQDDFGTNHLRAIPAYQKFHSRILALTEFESVSPARLAGGKLFYTRVPKGSKARAILEVAESDTAPGRVLLDSNTWPAEETLGVVVPSHDGRYVAYGVLRNASNWFELRFLETGTGRVLPDVLRGLNGSAPQWWSADSGGIYYSSFPLPEPGKERTQKLENQKARYHRLGTAQEADDLLFEAPDHPDWRFALRETDDGRYLVLTATVGTTAKGGMYFRETQRANESWHELLPITGESHTFRGSRGPVFWIQTDADAPRGRVVAVDVRRPGREHWKDVIPESKDTLNFVNLVDQRFIAVYVEDARHVIRVFDTEGTLERTVKFPDLGTTFSGFVGRRFDRYSYYSFNAVAYAPGASVFRLDARTGESVPFRQPKLSYDPADYETRQVFYTSKDGTRVPLHIAAKRGLELDGRNPLLLYAYGAGGWHAIPWFQPQVLAFLEAGGIYALANARGGGEYGEEWHEAGIKTKKQNTIDDFIAAAEWLVANRYTSRERLAINGGSLSSPLAGAALAQRPDLFGAVLMDISVTDMVRYDQFTGGAGWRAELGSSENPDEFRALLAYSPYHNLKPGTCYPPTLITAGERDETTVPSHSYKFAAALQAAQGCENPVLLQVMWGTGHMLGKDREQAAEILGRQLAFLTEALGVGCAEKNEPCP